MLFRFNNLGSIKEAEIELGNLTVICGKNNTGKTYLTYAVYGFLKKLENYVNTPNRILSLYAEKIVATLKTTSTVKIDVNDYYDSLKLDLAVEIEDFKMNIANIFHSNKDEFPNFNFEVLFDENYILAQKKDYLFRDAVTGLSLQQAQNSTIVEISKLPDEDLSNKEYYAIQYILAILFKDLFLYPFILCADRLPLKIFQKELDFNRIKIVEHLQKRNELHLINEKTARYPLPLEHHIDFIRDIEHIQTQNARFSTTSNYHEIVKEIEQMLNIQYQTTQGYNFVVDTKKNIAFPHYLASTSVRSLAELYYWIKHKASPNNLLMIDEPELSLHPENQLKIARLLVKLVNAGIKVWITTHSDYIIKEFNNLLMLSQSPQREQLLADLAVYGYTAQDYLHPEDIRFYTALYKPELEGCTVVRSKVGKYGIETPSFDETLDNLLFVSSKIENSLEED